MPRETDTYFRLMVSDFRAAAADIDVFGGDVIWTAELAEQGWIEDVTGAVFDEYGVRTFLPAPLDACTWRNRIFAVPWFTAVGMLYYRRDLLDAAGFAAPPETWDDLAAMALAIQAERDLPHGFVFQGAAYEGGVTNALEYIWNSGGRVLTGNVSVAGSPGMVVIDPNVVVVDSTDAARGLSHARSLVERRVAPERVTTYREADCTAAFLAGEAVFMRNWPFVYGLLDTEASALAPEQVGVARIPAGEPGMPRYSCLGGWNMMLNRRSPRQDAAWTFIRWMTAPEQMAFFAAEGGYLPARRALYEDPAVLETVPVARAGLAAVENARTRPASPFYSTVSPRIAIAFNRVLGGEISPEQAVARLERELRTILRTMR